MLITATSPGTWSDPTIWDSGTVPGSGDDVVINPSVQVAADSGTSANSIQFNQYSQLTCDGGTVAGVALQNLSFVSNNGASGSIVIQNGCTVSIGGTITVDGVGGNARGRR